MPPIITVENLGKRYRIGASPRNEGLRHRIEDACAKPFRWLKNLSASRSPHSTTPSAQPALQADEEFWALKNVSFEVQRGEVLGIIGRNGAGKSTLLKILSRITEPTEGCIHIRGRVASLLEVGTGFHPELTGRENIFLNGTILGMRRDEIKAKFDEIVAFAEIERFIDTPVKRYSSGMYVRLAFAVAAHLEPEILVVDEVLAVGDAEFQKKCLGKMQDVSQKEGRTVLFVSHNMGAVERLCSRCIYLKEGTIAAHGNTPNTLGVYMKSAMDDVSQYAVGDRTDRGGDGSLRVVGLIFKKDPAIELIFSYQCLTQVRQGLRFVASINNVNGVCVTYLDSMCDSSFSETPKEHGSVRVVISPDVYVPSGTYYINVAVFYSGVLADHVQNAYRFVVDAENPFGWSKAPIGVGACILKQCWSNAGVLHD
jgi:lipopolysaccharide transport system ATP-binding protein